MANYNPVYHSLWTSPKFEQLSPNEKLIYLYLITNERIEKSGIYSISIKHISCDCDLSKPIVEKALKTLIDKVLIKYQYNTNTIYIPNFFKFSKGMIKNEYILYKTISRQIELLDTDLWNDFIKDYEEIIDCKSINTLSIKYQSYNSNNNNKNKSNNKVKDKDVNIIKDVNKPFIENSRGFKLMVENYLGKPLNDYNENAWCNELRLCEKEQGKEQFEFMLRWYAKNIGKDYIPLCLAPKSFRSKFTKKLIPAVKRNKSTVQKINDEVDNANLDFTDGI